MKSTIREVRLRYCGAARFVARGCFNMGNIATLNDAVAAFNPIERISGETIIRVRP